MRPVNRWCYGCKRHVGNKQGHGSRCDRATDAAYSFTITPSEVQQVIANGDVYVADEIDLNP